MSSVVFIARALDGSWVSIAPTQEGAQAAIAEREPDLLKQSNYQILAEPLEKLLRNNVGGVTRSLESRLVKWDGDGPIPDDASTSPEKYPQVAEVLSGGDGRPTKTVYRRPDSCL